MKSSASSRILNSYTMILAFLGIVIIVLLILLGAVLATKLNTSPADIVKHCQQEANKVSGAIAQLDTYNLCLDSYRNNNIEPTSFFELTKVDGLER